MTDNWIDKTQQDYNIISKHFKHTRKHFWQELKPFLIYIKNQDKVLDIGCGNGRLLQALKQENKKISYWGIDFSSKLLKAARQNHPEANLVLGDITNTQTYEQLKNFDVCFCLAVFHHLPTPEIQLKTLKNIYKALKPNGILIISVWNLWQSEYWKNHLENIGWKLKKGFKIRWLKVPYHLSNGRKIIKTVNRLCYCFTLNELEDKVKQVNFKLIDYSKGKNLCLVAKKMVK
jgi:SAM-dependent methyltransferase